MMNKPSNYDTTEAFTGDGSRLTPGGKICVIVNAYEGTAKSSGKPMLMLEYDIAEGDEKGYFDGLQKQFGGDWRGIYRQGTVDADGNCSPWFKGMITAIEESNPGYKFNFDERTLIGKKFGGVFGDEEYIDKNNEIKVIAKLAQVRSVDSIRKGAFKVPEIKRVAKPQTNEPAYTSIDPSTIPF